MATLKNTTINDTGYLRLPSGTTAQRPGSPVAGMTRYNSEYGNVEYYDGTKWYLDLGTKTTSQRPASPTNGMVLFNPDYQTYQEYDGTKWVPDIVTSGLVVHLDAARNDSYPGSGTTWFDVSGNSNNATLVNGVGYSSANQGVMVFDGTNDYATIPLNLSTTNSTVIAVARWTGASNQRVISSISNNWLLGWWIGSTDRYFAEGWVTASSTNSNTSTNWFHYAGVGNYSSDVWQLYKNGSLLVSNSNGSQGPNGISLGRSGIYTGEISACNIAHLLVYNRVLTQSEIQQNFNLIKYRYGL